MSASAWIATCRECGRLIHRDGWLRAHPAGGVDVYSLVAIPASAVGSGDPRQRVGMQHRDCGLARYAGAPMPGPADQRTDR